MHVRPVTAADVPGVVDVGDAAFIDSELNAWVYPHRRAFPESRRARVLLAIRTAFAKPGVHGVVCVADSDDPADWPRGQIIGYASWERHGPASDPVVAKYREHNTGVFKAVERTLLGLQSRYVDYFRLDQTVDREAKAVFEKESAEYPNPFASVPGHWSLVVLGVHPDWQGKGVGKKIMQWGLERAAAEDVPITLFASPAGHPFYKRLGFDVVGWATTESVKWSEGGAVMILDPERRFTREVTEEERTRDYFGVKRKIDAVLA
ncbi:GNAT family protein [Colletotrichum musicola]|uniref:GNAT family protein n=1 Tax=Colletotrichum musicola TaxID=2175873 RepID=A0A8H6MY13_9PEZI|nr:GNAT family protein [Colletotrichum musicola]